MTRAFRSMKHVPAPATFPEGVSWIRTRLQSLIANRRGTKPATPPHSAELALLGERLSLAPDDLPIVLFLAAAAVDTGIPQLCAIATGSPQRPWPTFELALRMFPETSWSALTASGGLRRWRLIEIHQGGGEALLGAALRLDERVVDLLKGDRAPDDRIASLVTPLAVAVGAPSIRLAPAVDRVLSGGGSPVLLTGAERADKLEIATHVGAASGLVVWRLSASALRTMDADPSGFARLLLRELRLCGAVLYIDATSIDPHADAAALPALLERLAGEMVFVAARDVLPGLESALRLDVDRPPADEQRQAWKLALPKASADLAPRLAGQFRLSFDTIRRIGASAAASSKAAVWQAAREAARPDVGDLAVRVATTRTWDDLILPEPQMSLLHQLTGQAEHQWQVYEDWGFGRKLSQGLGITALFAGESGTGKTMAAGLIANAVGLDLYRVDLASVVNKYIGETEKNLRRIFDAFEDGGAILLFDEADALFGRRSEVKDSHDRYANIEVNYLLQRLEAYRGLAILSTNRRAAIDRAFLRRLRFVVTFPFPGVAEREKIWKGAFPAEMAREAIDCARLARLGLSGGNIQSVALNAAFRAAADGGPVRMEHVIAAARAEMQKLDVPFSEADLRVVA